jgi:hypothetical protein
MEKEFIPYTESLELKQLGFDEPCFATYNDKGELRGADLLEFNKLIKQPFWSQNEASAPTFSQAFRWFRQKYKVRFFIQSGMSDLGEFFKVIFPDGEQRGMSYTTHEEAELACLKKLIEIVKTKQL